MKVPFTHKDAAINDFITNNGLTHEEIDEPWCIKQINDCTRWINTDEQTIHKIVICPVINYKAELPKDFKLLQAAASNPDYRTKPCLQCDPYSEHKREFKRTRREHIISWIQGCDEGCELEINLQCPKCHKTQCECDSPVVEVDVDRIWDMSHPEIFYKNYTHLWRFGNGINQHDEPDFKLMGAAKSYLFNAEHFLTDCPNILCETCVHKFQIEYPFIKVDYQKGEVLISYLGRVTDEDGDLMIPDHPDAHDAIYQYLTHKYYFMKFVQTGEQRYNIIQQQAEIRFNAALNHAISALQIPDFKSFQAWVNDIWLRRIPKDIDSYANKETTDDYIKYKHYLKGRFIK